MSERWDIARYREELAKPRRSKYGNKRTDVDGLKFDSKKEAQRYRDLLLLERAGEIRELERQKTYEISVYGHDVTSYRCDFRYIEGEGRLVIEDVKGHRTELYKIKKRLMKAIYGIDIRET